MATTINFIILTLLGRVQEIIPGLAYVKPVMIGMLLGLIVLVAGWKTDRSHRKWRRPTLYWLLTSIGFVLTVPLSLWPTQSLVFLAASYLCTVILFLLVSQCVRHFKTLEAIGKGLVVMTLILGAAIVVHPKELVTESGFRLSVSDSYDSNDLAVVYAMGMPFLFYWFWRGGLFWKAVCVLAALLAVYGIYRTGSRGGLVALGAVVLYMIVRVRELGPFLRGALVAGLVVGGIAMTQTDTFEQLILALRGQDYNTTSDDGRIQIWKRGIGYAFTYPVTGVGVKCFDVAEGDKEISGRTKSVSGIRWMTAHNSYIQVAAECGLIVFAFWLAMIVSSFLELRRQRKNLFPWRRDPKIRRILVFQSMVRTSLWAYVVGACFLSLGYLPFLYLLVALTVALATITDRVVAELWEEEEVMAAARDDENEPLVHELPQLA